VAENSTTFTIDLGVAGSAAVDSAASSIQALESRLTGAQSAASKAAEAVRAGEASFRAQEAAADRASKALEKINVAIESASGKKLEQLRQRQIEAAAAADKAKVALLGEASALDRLKASAGDAAKATEQIKKQLDAQRKAADAAAKAAEASRGTGNLGKLSGALGKLGGPLGKVGGKATGAADAISNLRETVGALGPYIALAVGVVALATAMVTATIAATAWAISMADSARGTKELAKRSERLKKLTTSLFAGPKVQGAFDKFLSGLDSLVDLFDESNASGKAMRVVFDDIFGGLIDGAANFIPKIRTAFIEFQILVLKALIAIKPFGSTILKVGEVIAITAGVIIGLLVGALVVLTALVVGSVAFFGYLVVAVYRGIDAFFKLGGMLLDLVPPFIDLGGNLIMGLVKGITGAAGAVYESIKGVVGGAIDAAKAMLGIASPSKVFAEIGMNTGEGMAQGVEGATSGVQGALESMVAPTEAPDASSFSGGKGGASLNLAGASFVFNGVEGAEDAEARFGALLTRLLEGDAAQLGTGVSNA
jgi:hypothetical protein